jgi:hypothetical protein
MAKPIPPGQLRKWAEDQVMPELEKSFNAFIQFAAKELPAESPQYTGFYASSWKTAKTIPRPTETYQKLKGGSPKEPWYGIGLRLRKEGTGSVAPHVVPRFEVPVFKLNETAYIANTAIYARYALGKKVPKSTKYGGILPYLGQLPEKADEFFKGGIGVKVVTK